MFCHPDFLFFRCVCEQLHARSAMRRYAVEHILPVDREEGVL